MSRRSGNPGSYSSSPATATSSRQLTNRRPVHSQAAPTSATKLDFHALANFALHEKEYKEGVQHSKNGSHPLNNSNTFDEYLHHHKTNVNQQRSFDSSPSTARQASSTIQPPPATKLGFHDLANFALHGQEHEKNEQQIHSSIRNGSAFDDYPHNHHHHHHQKSNPNHVNYPSKPSGPEEDLIDFSSDGFGAPGSSSSSSSSSNVLIRSNSSGSATIGNAVKSNGSKNTPALVKGHSVDSADNSFNQDFPSLVPTVNGSSSSSVNSSVWDSTKSRLIGNGMSKLTVITKQVKPVNDQANVKAATSVTETIKTASGLVPMKRVLAGTSTPAQTIVNVLPKELSSTGNGIQTRVSNPATSTAKVSGAKSLIPSVVPPLDILVTKNNKSRENRNEFLKSLRSNSNKAGTDGNNKNKNHEGTNRNGSNGQSLSNQSASKVMSDPMKTHTTNVPKEGINSKPASDQVTVDLDKLNASPEERKGINALIEQHGINNKSMITPQVEGNHVVMGLDQVTNIFGTNGRSRLSPSEANQGLAESTSCDSILSSSLEAEQRLLREMGWQEDDADDSLFAPLTEDEVKEFQARIKTNNFGHSGQYQVGNLVGGSGSHILSAGNGLLDLNVAGLSLNSGGPPGFETRTTHGPPGLGLKQGSAFNPFFAKRSAPLTSPTNIPPAADDDSSSDDSSSDEE